jgi:16S rRNA (cytosine1402-N4)-methyltransferase
MLSTAHRPVLLSETVAALDCRSGGLWVDGTVGAGGHAEAILRATAPHGRLVGCDRDAQALDAARRRLAPFGTRAALHQADHRELPDLLRRLGAAPVDGLLLDLGVSSLQLDDARRGFSFRSEGPLDMRMDQRQTTTAAALVNTLPERELADLLRRCGEEPAARPIARAVVRERRRAPILTTTRLASIVASAAGGRSGPRRSRRGRAADVTGRGGTRLHPATRTFQALRIAVNRELEGLEELIRAAVELLAPGGRIAIISFHSLEDRIVKRTLRAIEGRCVCPRDLPICACGRIGLARVLTRRPVRPGPAELRDNPRSRSARLRAAARLEAPAPATQEATA